MMLDMGERLPSGLKPVSRRQPAGGSRWDEIRGMSAPKIAVFQNTDETVNFADCHGVLAIPAGIAAQLPAVAERLRQKDRRIVELCKSADCTAEKRPELHRENPAEAILGTMLVSAQALRALFSFCYNKGMLLSRSELTTIASQQRETR